MNARFFLLLMALLMSVSVSAQRVSKIMPFPDALRATETAWQVFSGALETRRKEAAAISSFTDDKLLFPRYYRLQITEEEAFYRIVFIFREERFTQTLRPPGYGAMPHALLSGCAYRVDKQELWRLEVETSESYSCGRPLTSPPPPPQALQVDDTQAPDAIHAIQCAWHQYFWEKPARRLAEFVTVVFETETGFEVSFTPKAPNSGGGTRRYVLDRHFATLSIHNSK
jgi:hypothetical protein